MSKAQTKLGGKKDGSRKKTRQGCGKFTKKIHNKRSRLYRKAYRGQGR